MQIEISRAEKVSAQIISYLFHPLFFPTIGLYLLLHSGTYLDSMNDEAKNFLYIIIGFSTCFLPLLSLPIFIYRRLIKNIEMENRTERVLPLTFVVAFYFLGYYLLNRLPLPQIITTYIASVTAIAAITLLITVWWKISFHTIGAGGLLGALLALSLKLETSLQMYIVIVLLIAGLVSTARLMLNAHTPLQIFTGFVTGFSFAFLWMYLL
jgi:membrane-associated phospholipid phosphatase